MLFYRLWHIKSFIHQSLDMINEFRFNTSVQVKAISDIPILNHNSPSLKKRRIISTMYYKRGKSFIEMIQFRVSYAMRITSSIFFAQMQRFSIIDYSYCFGSAMKNCEFIFKFFILIH